MSLTQFGPRDLLIQVFDRLTYVDGEDLDERFGDLTPTQAADRILDAFEAEIRKGAATTVRGMAPKYLDDATDVAIFHALDAAAAAITKPTDSA